jgi:diguanylate cyclase (GGDEF)-like protein
MPGGEGYPPTVGVTVSVGVASWPELSAERTEDLLTEADRALYRAKAGGRNRCVTATP